MKVRVKTVILTLLFILSSIIGGAFLTGKVYAQGNDISGLVVRDLEVSQSQINDGERFKVTVKFAEDDTYSIKNGDIINITWTRENEISLNGFSTSIPLDVQGINVGQAVIRENGATITFNEKVDKLNEVEGFVSFEVSGRNFAQTSEEDTKEGFIRAGNKDVSVSVVKPKAGTNSVFYYKTGNMDHNDTEHVNWWLNANMNKGYVAKEIRIEDQIQGGQELDKDSFYITVTDHNEEIKTFSGQDALYKFAQEYVGCSITVDGNKISVYISAGHASHSRFVIYYRTSIKDFKQKEFENHSQAWYQEWEKEAVEGQDFNYTVKNINVSAGITGTIKGELKIVKNLAGTKEGIAGVKFRLQNSQGTVIKDGQSEIILETNEEGIANIKNLSVGSYKVKEVSAPKWIDFDPLTAEELKFEVNADDTEGTLLTVENKAKKIDIPVEKKWLDSKGNLKDAAGEVTVELFRDKKPLDPAKRIVLTKDNLKAVFEDLDQYDKTDKHEYEYTVRELDDSKAVVENEGSIKFEDTWYKVQVLGSGKDGFVITNQEKPKQTPLTPATTSLKVEKEWKNTEVKNAPEVTVYLIKNGENTKEELKLNKNNGWSGEFKNLKVVDDIKSKKVNVYTIKEKNEVDGRIVLEGITYKVSYDGGKVINTKVEEPKKEEPKEPKKEEPKEPKKEEPKAPKKEFKKANKEETRKKEENRTSPKTGDFSNTGGYFAIMLISGLIVYKVQKKEEF